ncbi:F-box domain-containing protein [Mycena sanguinolenta]|uniref:F-box domain-containing protein n=1 Tax=Mycena sanguinolenta TaxID=230812 RepID=A0A8H6ZGJ9_9AGAR|nr:F-box domain-containing protein [Mycena sanguinolenta]
MEATEATISKSRKFFSFKKTRNTRLHPVKGGTSLVGLPFDILNEILGYIPRNCILNLCLLSRNMFSQLVPVLYASIDLKSSSACRTALKRLVSEPDLCSHIRKFTVRPNHPSRWGSEKSVDESWVVDCLEQLASSGHLENLNTFIWDGLESPKDSLWLVLRLNCPLLRYVGTSVGLTTQRLLPESHLFDFRDLVGFSLVTQKFVRWINLYTGQPVPDRLWEMLLVHSPNLVELTIDGTCLVSQLWNIRKIFTGRWRFLRSLSLGNVSSRSLDTDTPEGTAFLAAHPRLENLTFFGSLSGYSNGVSSLPLMPLPRLETFTGKINQLKEISSTQLPALRTIRLCDFFSPAAQFAPILQNFHSVTSLAVSSTSSFPLDYFSDAIHLTPHLRSFILTLPRKRKLTDQPQSMGKFALRIASKYPSLEEFTIRDVADWDHEDQLNENYRLSALAGGPQLPLRGSFPTCDTKYREYPSHFSPLNEVLLVVNDVPLPPKSSLRTGVYGLRRYNDDRAAAVIDMTAVENKDIKVRGFMSPPSKIYLADVFDYMEYILNHRAPGHGHRPSDLHRPRYRAHD